MSVCLYAIITAENVTCTMNISLHFGFEYPLVMQVYGFFQYALVDDVFFWWSKPVFICVNTGPLALTKIYFFCLYAISTARIATHLCAVCDKCMLHSP